MTKTCISNNINQIHNCTHFNDSECSASKEHFKLCYWLNYHTLTGFEVIWNE